MADRVEGRRVSRRILRGFRPELLTAARKRAGMSKGTLARLANVGVGSVYRWEAGTYPPQVDTLRRVCEVLELSIADVVHVEDDETYLGDLRVRRGLTQPELAYSAGISTAHLSALERGEVRLSEATCASLATALGVDDGLVNQAWERARHRPA